MRVIPEDFKTDIRWLDVHLIAFEIGFCSVGPDGEPVLEYADADDLIQFKDRIIGMVKEQTK